MLPLAPNQEVACLLTNTTNVLSSVYSNVYYPTYSNGLKEIGGYLGCSWSVQSNFGAESVVWRKWWEVTLDGVTKETLILYNLDDCRALKIIVSHLRLLSGKEGAEALGRLGDDAVALAE